ncbi:hypothetical protein HMPREF3219_0201047 [Streptococcus salivarius]|nr:hypothetical protein HMPREF3219_0201047 [Streptococcus salivarius]
MFSLFIIARYRTTVIKLVERKRLTKRLKKEIIKKMVYTN